VHGRVAVRGKTSSQEMKRAGVFSALAASRRGIRVSLAHNNKKDN
jgi:hypothetical protein